MLPLTNAYPCRCHNHRGLPKLGYAIYRDSGSAMVRLVSILFTRCQQTISLALDIRPRSICLSEVGPIAVTYQPHLFLQRHMAAVSPTDTAIISTKFGKMMIELWPDVAPSTVENFKRLAREGFYNGTTFHRIIPKFMIQGGCPNTKPGAGGMPGCGGPGYHVNAEFSNRRHQFGVVSMARAQHIDSAGSQFFICLGDAPFLDGQYTCFGQVIAGLEVLSRIALVRTRAAGGENSAPVERIEMEVSVGDGPDTSPETPQARAVADAEGGNVEAMRFLGYSFALGSNGFDFNPSQSSHWFHAAASHRDALSLQAIGDLFAYGIWGVPGDLKKALTFYDAARQAAKDEIALGPSPFVRVQAKPTNPGLIGIVGPSAMTLCEMQLRVWEYLMKEGLVNSVNPMVIAADGRLAKTFGLSQNTILLHLRTHLFAECELAPEQSEEKSADSSAVSHPRGSIPASGSHQGQATKLNGGINSLLEQLRALIGLASVKDEVNSLINLIRVRRLREANRIQSPPVSLHMVFTGNPGTGKTTVARLLAEIFKELQLLSKGHLVEVDRSGLVAGYVGQTAIKTREVCGRALGGVLFIDEAYSLASAVEQDFGREAIETLLKFMEDHRDDLIVIVAGYRDRMEGFLRSNPGLQSRFNRFIDFPDYSVDELVAIFQSLAAQHQYQFDGAFETSLRTVISNHLGREAQPLANGRLVRNFFEKAISRQSNRVAAMDAPTPTDLQQLLAGDLCH